MKLAIINVEKNVTADVPFKLKGYRVLGMPVLFYENITTELFNI